MRHDFGAESSRPASSLCTLRTHQSPSEWQHSLPACLLGFDRTGLSPVGLHQEVSPSHLQFPLFQTLPSAIFTVPTITFGVLYCFFVIRHDRRRILHVNVTRHPTSRWIIQQLREAFPFGAAPRFLIHDRDAKYGTEVPAAVRSLKINAVRTSFESPWQNGVAERWVGSCRRELLDHVIALNERHLKRLLSQYLCYHHEDRTHLGLGKGTPGCRTRCVTSSRVLSLDRLGGLHHRYDRAA